MRLTVARDDGAGRRWTETYEVPESPGMTVLDALAWIREHEDATLAVRFSCRSANACRECLAVVDGERTYLCTSPAVGEVAVGPIPNKAVVRDLVTRM